MSKNPSVQYLAPRSLTTRAIEPLSELAPASVRIAPSFIGICGTDLHIYLGHMHSRVAEGTVLGHEASGTVTEVGADVTEWRVGDQVCVFPIISCGVCRTCRSGNAHVCPRLQLLGIDVDGAMQLDCTVPAENLIRISNSVPLQTATLAEPLAVAVHDVRRSRLVRGELALVVGAGPVGILIAMVARELGAEVTIVELNEYRREFAASLGFSTMSPDEAAHAFTLENAPDAAFEVTGSANGMTVAYESLVPGGRLVVVGIHSEPRALDLRSMFEREVEVLGARLYSREDFERAVELVETGSIDPAPLISHVKHLDSAEEAFDQLLAGGSAMKVLLSATPGL